MYYTFLRMVSICFCSLFMLAACQQGNSNSNTKISTVETNKEQIKQTNAYLQELDKQISQHQNDKNLSWHFIEVADSLRAYKAALEKVDALIKNDSSNYMLWFKKAQLLEHASDTAAALVYYNVAAKIYATPEVMIALANLYAETKNPLTLSVCNEIRKFKTGKLYDSYAAFFTGIYFARKQQFNEALTNFNECIALNYTLIDAHIEKGILLFDHQHYQEALNTFETASNVSTLNADAVYWQAKCYATMNKNLLAKKFYEKALTLDPTLTEAKTALDKLR